MNPIPTPTELYKQWDATVTGIEFAHSILAPMIEEARNAQQPEPWGEGHRLLIVNKDTIQEGDEMLPDKETKWESVPPNFIGSPYTKIHAWMRRQLRNPWRRIKDAPPEHKEAICVVTGGKYHSSICDLGGAFKDRTHYFLETDLPPVPPRDKEREKFEKWEQSIGDGVECAHPRQLAWEAWQAARKEKP